MLAVIHIGITAVYYQGGKCQLSTPGGVRANVKATSTGTVCITSPPTFGVKAPPTHNGEVQEL